ncbi:protein CPR [Salix suchowensis]|nr:protein CPR [Salix suchowensis]
MTPPPSQPPSSSSVNKSPRVSYKLRSPKVVFAPVRRRGGVGDGDVEAIALPLGMSFAVVVAQVLERKDAAGERMSVDHLSMICTSAVRESLANVFGDKFDFFTRNFQKSFGSTLSTLRLINETSINRGPRASIHQNLESSTSNRTIKKRVDCTNSACMEDCDSETDLLNNSTEGHTHKLEQVEENISVGCSGQELVLHGQTNQLACAPSSYPLINMYNNMEKSVVEQARSNDLKALEIGVAMKRLKLDEDLLNLTSESNYLERSKLVMGMSRASFKVDKFKTQLEDTRHAELHRKCIDCLVAGLFIMSASLSYSAYVYSYRRIKEATASCSLSHKESKLGWFVRPFSSFNSWLQILTCQVQVVSQMAFGILIILAVAFLLVQRSSTSNRTMPITFILLLLGAFCGFTGKLCVDTLGGSGSLWLLYWEASCSLQFLSIACTPTLFRVLHGPVVRVSQGTKPGTIFPYWLRRLLFYATSLLFLPLCCGLLPFAGPGEWTGHFCLLKPNLWTSQNG